MWKLILLVIPFISFSTSLQASSRALIVGINKYQNLDARYQLEGCANDATAYQEMLQSKFGLNPNDITFLLDEAGSRDRIVTELNRIKSNLSATDSAVFIYCGHGVQVPDNQANEEQDGLDEALVPSDAVPKKASSLILDDELTQIFEAAGGPQWTVILDACHSATATRNLVFNPSGAKVRSLPTSLFFDSQTKSVQENAPPSVSDSHGMIDGPNTTGTRSVASRKTCVFAACQDEGIAGEDPETRHGYFTQHMLELLNTGKIQPQQSTYAEVASFAETVFRFPKDGSIVEQKSSAEIPDRMKNLVFISGADDKISPTSPDGLSVRLSTGGSNLYVGDLLQLTVVSDRDGYLTVINIDADGNRNCLYPNDKHPDHAIRANQPLEIPGSAGEFKLRIVDKDARGRPLRLGAERIVAFVTSTPWVPSWFEKVTPSGGLRSIDPTGLKAVRVDSDTEELPEGEHTKAEVTFQTLPN